MKSNQLHFLITAGGTKEYIDPVRFITNASSGKMGCALSDAALKAGRRVTLITTIKNLKFKTCPEQGRRIENLKLKIVEAISADEMFKAVKKHFKKCDCLIMAAAVADYTPVEKSKVKIKKSKKNLVIRLRPTVDILKWAGKNKKKRQIVVGFALEDKNLQKNAEKKLKDKNIDMVIVNSPAAIGRDKAAVQIKQRSGRWIKMPAANKSKIAKEIVRQAANFILIGRQNAAKH